VANSTDELALNHAMKHFEIHAAQRLTAFNFFIVISGAILAAIATILQKPDKFGWAGIFLGLLLVLLSYIFWKLDRRTKFLIKHSETAIKQFEIDNLKKEFQVFSNESAETHSHRQNHNYINRMFSYSEAFGLLFIGSGIMGFAGAITIILLPTDLSQSQKKKNSTSEVQQKALEEELKSRKAHSPVAPVTPVKIAPTADSNQQTLKADDLDAARQKNGS
jgi:FtsZ-binding cell division protein ZapB